MPSSAGFLEFYEKFCNLRHFAYFRRRKRLTLENKHEIIQKIKSKQWIKKAVQATQKNPAPAWKCFRKVYDTNGSLVSFQGSNLVICDKCDAIYRFSSGTTTLNKHSCAEGMKYETQH